jgi:hypothetical protein
VDLQGEQVDLDGEQVDLEGEQMDLEDGAGNRSRLGMRPAARWCNARSVAADPGIAG